MGTHSSHDDQKKKIFRKEGLLFCLSVLNCQFSEVGQGGPVGQVGQRKMGNGDGPVVWKFVFFDLDFVDIYR